MIAGLGIGGLALALAAQDSVKKHLCWYHDISGQAFQAK